MVGYSFLLNIFFFYNIYLHLELITYYIFKKFWLITLYKKKRIFFKIKNFFNLVVPTFIYYIPLCFFFFTFKISYLFENKYMYIYFNWFVFIFFIFLALHYIFWVIYLFNNKINSFLSLIIINGYIFFMWLYFIDSFLTFFFYLSSYLHYIIFFF